MNPRQTTTAWLVLLFLLFAAPASDQAASCLQPPANLVGWWPGDGNANDIAGTNENGTLMGGAIATAAGLDGQAFSFDGTSGFVQIPDSPALDPANLTIETWVRFASLDSSGFGAPAGDQYMVFKQNSHATTFEGYDLSKTRVAGGDVFRFLLSSAAGQSVEIHSTTFLTAGVWYHVAAVRGSNFAQIYVNGHLQSQASVSFPQDYGTQPLYFGTTGASYWDRKLNGMLDEVSLYNRALSSNEIAALYAAGAAGKCKTPVAPIITNQPQNLSIHAGSNALFTVTVVGTAPLSYQWQFGNTPITGATNASLTLTNVQLTNGGGYAVVITNIAGSATSAVATLTVLAPPVITTQPQNSTNDLGTTATFTASSTGTAPLFYQWSQNGSALADNARTSGSAGNVLTISNIQPSDAGSYVLVVSNSFGTATSTAAVLAISGPPAIVNQPAGQSALSGTNVSFSVLAVGSQPLSYQWQLGNTPLAGATNTSLTLTNVQFTNGGSYTVVITNIQGSATSTVAVLTVLAPPVLTAQPQSSTNHAGTTASFSATSIGTAPLLYQWLQNGVALTNGARISGSTSNVLGISNLQPTDAAAYVLTVSNSYGATTSTAAVLTVSGPPAILTQPVSQGVFVGANVSLGVLASGTQPLSYQWMKNGANLADGGNLSGSQSSALALANVQTNASANYQVIITNSEGSITSAVATLVVSPQPSVIGAGAVVLVNSSSPKYLDFQHFIQPYLDTFGVPYTVLDIASNSIGTNLAHYASIIIGHKLLDTNGVYLNSLAQSNISLAVSNGTGLVNFDSALSVGSTPRYGFIQNIFGFGYGASTSGTNVTLPPTQPSAQMHYITARHQPNDSLTLYSNMSLATLTLPSNVTAVALSSGKPLLAINQYGQGRAVQWASYDWISVYVKGPVAGLDDLVWRSLVWSARKPFVLRGMPNFVTMRVDDVSGPFTWVHSANAFGFKPFLALFVSNVTTASAVDLRGMATNGLVTTSIHSWTDTSFFYYDHDHGQAWPDNVISNNFAMGTAWHATNHIPISKMMIAHWSEMGSNSFAGLKAWGVEYVLIEIPPGVQEYITPPAPWLTAGPYRLYETPLAGESLNPMFYADFLNVPGHPEFNGQFFDPYTEIRDAYAGTVAEGGDWAPDTDVGGSVDRGTKQIQRGLDSMTLGNVFTHERYPSSLSDSTWRLILQGISNNLAAYNPIYVTMDYANQYQRAKRTSRLLDGEYDRTSGQITLTFSGKADMDTTVQVFIGADSGITNSYATIPSFLSGSTNTVAVSNVPPVITTQPRDVAVAAGTGATFSVANTGSWPLAYQWLFNGTNITGATNIGYTVPQAQPTNVGAYSVIVSNQVGVAASSNATLTIILPPAITNQPADLTVSAGSNAAFTVGVASSVPVTYQWLLNTTNIPNATNSSYSLLAAQASDAGTYTVIVTNLAGSATSSNAILTVIVPPVITNQPASQTVNAGSDVTLTVGVSGSQPLSYQWQKWGRNLSGATASALFVPRTQPINTGKYSVIVTNAAGVVTSAVAVLTITPAPPPALTGVIQGSKTNKQFILSFPANPGQAYVVQYTGKLETHIWTTLTNVTATGTTVTCSDSVTDWPRRFYRVLVASVLPEQVRLTGALAGPQFVLAFNSTSGKTYTIEYEDLPGSWSVLTNITAGATNVSFTNPVIGPKRLFRVSAPPD